MENQVIYSDGLSMCACVCVSDPGVQTVRPNYKLGGVRRRLSFGSSRNFLWTSSALHVRQKRRCRKPDKIRGETLRLAANGAKNAANIPLLHAQTEIFIYLLCSERKIQKNNNKTYKDGEKKKCKTLYDGVSR